MSDQAPVILELAPLPREQMGPFVVLGVDKDADREQIEAAWAQRVIAARKAQVKVPLEDINWAREVVNDPERRPRAEVTSINPDTGDGTLRRLASSPVSMAAYLAARVVFVALVYFLVALVGLVAAERLSGMPVPDFAAAVLWMTFVGTVFYMLFL